MPLNFIQIWADRKPARRWPIVIAGLVVAILSASTIDFYTERARFIADCARKGRVVKDTTDGDIACIRAPKVAAK